jgi:osmotically inducible protein OsmC
MKEVIMPVRKGDAFWEGNLVGGKGKIRLLNQEMPYSFSSRFEEGQGTNPEELIGAAHAGCMAMALSHELAEKGHTPRRVDATAQVNLAKGKEGFAIEDITLTVVGDVPGMDEKQFVETAEAAGQNCPVSKALAGVKIHVKASLK